MPNYGQKVAVARTLEQFAQRKAAMAIELTGRALPASVVSVVSSGIVMIRFELTNVPFSLPQITVPVQGSEYIRLPIQPGMLGWVTSADAYLGGMSGLGGGTADLTQRPNLSNLVWSPLGNANWSAADDPNAVVIYGPDGAVIRTQDSTRKIKVNGSGASISVQEGDIVTIGATGTVQKLLNALAAAVFNAHTHAALNTPPPLAQQMTAADMTTILKAE